MADINKVDVKLMQSQRLDDTEQGGGQMTSAEVVSGQINNLFPDISRFDRVYGRVSVRKAYLAVQTLGRETYYGSHTILTKQASDPNVSVCFFSSEDWFDTREDAKNRMESYLVRGPLAQMSLWGDHYIGTSVLSFLMRNTATLPEVGDVIVLKSSSHEQYARIVEIDAGAQDFIQATNNYEFSLNVVQIKIGSGLEYDFIGVEADPTLDTTNDPTLIYTTVAADASRYYGVAKLQESVNKNDLSIRVDDIMAHLVPSAASETAITDAGVGVSISPLIQTNNSLTVTRQIQYYVASSSKTFIGEGIKRGSLNFIAHTTITDDRRGNLLAGSQTIGTIVYSTGAMTFSNPGGTYSGTGTITYTPAVTPQQISETGAIVVDTNNRGFVYTFNCDPIPQTGTLRVEYLSAGKWYTMWDDGTGKLSGLEGYDVGSGQLNYNTGTVAVTLKAMPDVDSNILFFWTKPAEYYDFSGETLPLEYKFKTDNEGIVKGTFLMSWIGNALGHGPSGEYGIIDNNGVLVVGHFSIPKWAASHVYAVNDVVISNTGFAYKCTVGGTSHSSAPVWPVVAGETVVDNTVTWQCIVVPVDAEWTTTAYELGTIKYPTGEVRTTIHSTQNTPKSSENFTIKYIYGPPVDVTVPMPARGTDSRIRFNLEAISPGSTPIIPGTFRIEWHCDIVEYEVLTRLDPTRDPAYIFVDDGAGNLKDDERNGTVNYTTGDVDIHPDRTTVFPNMVYAWKVTQWLHPGVVETRVFDHIEYLPTANLFPPERDIYCSFCVNDGSNQGEMTCTLTPTFIVKEDSGLELVPGGLSILDHSNKYIIDAGDGRLYYNVSGLDGSKTQVGTVDYSTKTFYISSDNIDIKTMLIKSAVGTAAIDPVMSMVFRAHGAPIRAGSAFIKATASDGTVLEGVDNGSGNFIGEGVGGKINYDTGLCNVYFGVMVTDDADAQAEDWYNPNLVEGGMVFKPYVVRASSVLMNCVVTSYLPLDPDLLGLNPVRLPIDGKVPIFRDGYVIAIHHTDTYTVPDLPYLADTDYYVGRKNVDLIEVYDTPDDPDPGEEYSSDYPEYVPEIALNGDINYTYNKKTGILRFTTDFDPTAYKQPFRILHRIEDMALASDVQITGHISITHPLTHDYTGVQENSYNPALVSSVLPSGDLQSRAYNEFVQSSWKNIWSDERIGNPPLANYNFVDFPITVKNKPSIKERWLVLFSGTGTVSVVGENFGVMAENIPIITGTTLPTWEPGKSGAFVVNGVKCLVIASRQFVGEYYWKMPLEGFGSGWASGNCIRFNQDAANFPLWFVRTTLQAPPTEPVDNYTIQIRGDSS